MAEEPKKTKSSRKKREKEPKHSPRTVEVEEDDDNPLMDSLPLESVVKVYASLTDPNYECPWQMESSEDISGSGFVITGKKILTNAHCVQNATFVTVRKFGSADKVPARVICVSYDCDLAILTVDEKSFWKSVKPVDFSTSIPYLQDEVLVAGYPEGGDNISVTRGIVSRIEPIEYTASLYLLAVQIDAAVNSGNSGGPVFKGKKVIGVAFSGLEDTDGISYIVPCTIVQHFLTEFDQKMSFGGFCSLGIRSQSMENKRMRQAHKMTSDMTGLLIYYIDPLSPAHGIIKKDDILLTIDAVKIANDGTVRYRKKELIHFSYLIQQKFPGSVVQLEILRAGEKKELTVPLVHIPELVPSTRAALAHYVCWAGLVFVPLTIPYLEKFGEWEEEAPGTLRKYVYEYQRKFKEQQVVVLARVLVDEVNFGYEEEENVVLTKINGEEVKNLVHALRILDSCTKGFIRFEMENERIMVFDAEEAIQRSPHILKTHKIPTRTNLIAI